MIKGKFLSLAFIMVSFLGVTIWSLFNYDRAFSELVKYNQLSAWSLAQLELELHGFDEQLSLYRSGQTDAGQLNKAYDIAWNRLEMQAADDASELTGRVVQPWPSTDHPRPVLVEPAETPVRRGVDTLDQSAAILPCR